MLSGTTSKVKFFDQTDNLKEFIAFLRKNEPFTIDEEISAFERYHKGDENAFNEIILRNQRYIYSLAKEYARNEGEVMDYVNEGNIGLIEALKRFDYTKGFKFITFAVWYIRRSMNAYLMNERDMLTKSNNAKLGKKLDKIKSEFYAVNGRFPSIEEIKTILRDKYNIEIKDDSDLYDIELTSINSKVDDDYTVEDSDLFNDKTSTENNYKKTEYDEYIKTLVSKILDIIPAEHKELVKKVYNIGYPNYTLQMVCDEYNMDEETLKVFLEERVFSYIRQQIKDVNVAV